MLLNPFELFTAPGSSSTPGSSSVPEPSVGPPSPLHFGPASEPSVLPDFDPFNFSNNDPHDPRDPDDSPDLDTHSNSVSSGLAFGPFEHLAAKNDQTSAQLHHLSDQFAMLISILQQPLPPDSQYLFSGVSRDLFGMMPKGKIESDSTKIGIFAHTCIYTDSLFDFNYTCN